MRHAGAAPDGGDIARAGSFLIDPSGKLLWSDIAENFRVRPAPAETLAAIDKVLAE